MKCQVLIGSQELSATKPLLKVAEGLPVNSCLDISDLVNRSLSLWLPRSSVRHVYSLRGKQELSPYRFVCQ